MSICAFASNSRSESLAFPEALGGVLNVAWPKDTMILLAVFNAQSGNDAESCNTGRPQPV